MSHSHFKIQVWITLIGAAKNDSGTEKQDASVYEVSIIYIFANLPNEKVMKHCKLLTRKDTKEHARPLKNCRHCFTAEKLIPINSTYDSMIYHAEKKNEKRWKCCWELFMCCHACYVRECVYHARCLPFELCLFLSFVDNWCAVRCCEYSIEFASQG